MLARTYGPRYDRFPCYVQPKLNGVRALYQSGTWQSRDGKVWKLPVLHHLTVELLSIVHHTRGRMLDGELYVHGWRLQRINGAIAVNRTGPGEDTAQVEFHVFDTPHPTLSFFERWLELANALRETHCRHIKVVDTGFASNREQLDHWFHSYTAQGYEGVMLRPDGPYEVGETAHGTTKRSEYLWKYKYWEDDEFMCVGVIQGLGKADIGVGSFELANKDGTPIYDPLFAGPPRCGTGLDDEERIEYMKNPPIGKLLKIRFTGRTRANVPFHPVFLAVLE